MAPHQDRQEPLHGNRTEMITPPSTASVLEALSAALTPPSPILSATEMPTTVTSGDIPILFDMPGDFDFDVLRLSSAHEGGVGRQCSSRGPSFLHRQGSATSTAGGGNEAVAMSRWAGLLVPSTSGDSIGTFGPIRDGVTLDVELPPPPASPFLSAPLQLDSGKRESGCIGGEGGKIEQDVGAFATSAGDDDDTRSWIDFPLEDLKSDVPSSPSSVDMEGLDTSFDIAELSEAFKICERGYFDQFRQVFDKHVAEHPFEGSSKAMKRTRSSQSGQSEPSPHPPLYPTPRHPSHNHNNRSLSQHRASSSSSFSSSSSTALFKENLTPSPQPASTSHAWLQDIIVELLIDQEGFRSVRPSFKLMACGPHVHRTTTTGTPSPTPNSDHHHHYFRHNVNTPSPSGSARPNSVVKSYSTEIAHFTPTQRQRFHFHYAAFDGCPVLRRVTVNGDERMDYISRQAALSVKENGVYTVHGTEVLVQPHHSGVFHHTPFIAGLITHSGGTSPEGKLRKPPPPGSPTLSTSPRRSGISSAIPAAAVTTPNAAENGVTKLDWTFEYFVEDRRIGLSAKRVEGEKTLTPLSFSCSPMLLHPQQAKRVRLMHVMKKSVATKLHAEKMEVALPVLSGDVKNGSSSGGGGSGGGVKHQKGLSRSVVHRRAQSQAVNKHHQQTVVHEGVSPQLGLQANKSHSKGGSGTTRLGNAGAGDSSHALRNGVGENFVVRRRRASSAGEGGPPVTPHGAHGRYDHYQEPEERRRPFANLGFAHQNNAPHPNQLPVESATRHIVPPAELAKLFDVGGGKTEAVKSGWAQEQENEMGFVALTPRPRHD